MRAFSTKPLVLGYGESMLRYAPMRRRARRTRTATASRPAVAPFMRSVGGARAQRARRACAPSATRRATRACCPRGRSARSSPTRPRRGRRRRRGRALRARRRRRAGTFTVLPEERRVRYQRAGSAHARAPAPGSPGAPFDWGALLGGGAAWVHATGITPVRRPPARALARARRRRARGGRAPLGRPQLAAAARRARAAWADVLPAVAAPNCELLVLSLATVRPVGRLLGCPCPTRRCSRCSA